MNKNFNNFNEFCSDLDKNFEIEIAKSRFVQYQSVLVLLFGIFLLSSKWVLPPSIGVDLPTVSKEFTRGDLRPINETLIVSDNCRIFYKHHMYDFRQIGTIFHSINKKHQVLLIIADKTTEIDKVIDIAKHAKMVGYFAVQIAIKK